jgi:hypothetical protein
MIDSKKIPILHEPPAVNDHEKLKLERVSHVGRSQNWGWGPKHRAVTGGFAGELLEFLQR